MGTKTKTKPKPKPKAKKAPAKGATTWKWKAGSRFRVKAPVAKRELDRIRQSAGELTPATVVDAAADPDNPLHVAFEWDDTLAAQKHREQQARMLMNSIYCVRIEEGDPDATETVAFLSVSVADEGRMYLPTTVVMSDVDYRQQALHDALMSLKGWQRRYRHLTELARVFDAIEAVAAKVPTRKRAA